MDEIILVNAIVIPFFVGVVIPFLTNWVAARGAPIYLETFLNILLSAATGVLTTISFSGDWKEFLLAFGVAWVGALRGHYLGLAQALYSNGVKGKHELDNDPP